MNLIIITLLAAGVTGAVLASPVFRGARRLAVGRIIQAPLGSAWLSRPGVVSVFADNVGQWVARWAGLVAAGLETLGISFAFGFRSSAHLALYELKKPMRRSPVESRSLVDALMKSLSTAGSVACGVPAISAKRLERILRELSPRIASDRYRYQLPEVARLLTKEFRNGMLPIESAVDWSACWSSSKSSQDRLGFVANRIMSYPETKLTRFADGFAQLGGLIASHDYAWNTLREFVVWYSDKAEDVERVFADHLIVTRAMANWQGVDVEIDDRSSLRACLIETKDRRVIYLSSTLSSERKSFAVLHELAHYVLRHDAPSAYGLDASLADSEERERFDIQESTANALASVWSHFLVGLPMLSASSSERHMSGRNSAGGAV